MNPRNLILFRLPLAALRGWFDSVERNEGASFSIDPPPISAALDDCRLKPVGPLELSARGFVPPMGTYAPADSEDNPGTSLYRRIGDAVWITVGGEDKLLPAAVVNDHLQKKLVEIEACEGRKPGGRTRKRIKDELVTELLPRAFVRPVRTDALIDTALGVIAVDASSRKVAESVVSEIRRALGSFPALPVNAEVSPRAILTGWVAGDPLPDGLSLGEDCELRDPTDTGAVVRVQRMELAGHEIAEHLAAGKQVTRLALVLDDHVSFTLGEDLVVRKFRLLDGALDSLESTEREDIGAELDARFALTAGEFKRLFAVLEAAFKLSKAEG